MIGRAVNGVVAVVCAVVENGLVHLLATPLCLQPFHQTGRNLGLLQIYSEFGVELRRVGFILSMLLGGGLLVVFGKLRAELRIETIVVVGLLGPRVPAPLLLRPLEVLTRLGISHLRLN